MLESKDDTRQRAEMVEKQLRRRGIRDPAVLAAMLAVPRHEFVPAEFRSRAYEDVPLPIGGGQTISQPYIVAAMTLALRPRTSDRALEIGTGCGYQAAVLSLLGKEVFTIERQPELASAASERLTKLGYANVHVHCGDGTMGLPEFAPYDAIIVAAAAPSVPEPLSQQLADGGRMIAPVGSENHQVLLFVRKAGTRLDLEQREPCRFVPLLGRHGWKETD